MTKQHAPPKALSKKAAAIWTDAAKQFELSDSDFHMLETACLQYDRYLQAKAIVDKEGPYIKNTKTGIFRLHPCAQLEKEAFRNFCQAWKLLGLHIPEGTGAGPGRQPEGNWEAKRWEDPSDTAE